MLTRLLYVILTCYHRADHEKEQERVSENLGEVIDDGVLTAIFILTLQGSAPVSVSGKYFNKKLGDPSPLIFRRNKRKPEYDCEEADSD